MARKLNQLPIDVNPEELNSFCRKWRVRELALFGSVVRGDFGPDSDVDVLVSFSPNTTRPGNGLSVNVTCWLMNTGRASRSVSGWWRRGMFRRRWRISRNCRHRRIVRDDGSQIFRPV